MIPAPEDSLSDEELRALVHDTLCRLAAVSASCPRHWCRLRRCRRSGLCLGTLRQYDDGPELLLPPCIAHHDAPPAEAFRAGLRYWADAVEEHGMAAFDSPPRQV